MNNYKSGGFKSGGSKFSGKNKFRGDKERKGGQNREQRSTNPNAEMFSATCSECGNKCEVPFRPSGDKPVYCSTCFGAKKNANESRGSFDGGDRSAKNSNNNERSNNARPPRDQHSPRHDSSQGRGDEGIADLKRQITGLEVKLNRILDLINPPMPSQKATPAVSEKVVIKVTRKDTVKTPKKVATKKVVAKAASKKTATKATPKKAAAKKAAKKVAKKAKK